MTSTPLLPERSTILVLLILYQMYDNVCRLSRLVPE